jgi:hypothetical protein
MTLLWFNDAGKVPDDGYSVGRQVFNHLIPLPFRHIIPHKDDF